MGSKQGLLGKGVQANAMWVKERQVKQEVVLFIECTAQFQEQQAVTDSLQSLYEFQSVILGPDDFGLPATRKRKFTVGVLRTWGYLDTALSEIGKMFRIRRTGGDLYLAAPQSEIIDHLGARAVERGLPKHAANHMQSEELLPPAMAVRRAEYKSQLDAQGSTLGFCMLGQNSETFGHLSETMPALLQKSVVWCFTGKFQRELLPKEHLVVMGVPAYEALTAQTGYSCPFQGILSGSNAISGAQIKALAGNSIVVPVFGHLVTFVLAHLCQRLPLSDDVG